MKVFLDDKRIPEECIKHMHLSIGKLNSIYLEDWTVVRNYLEFTKVISENIDIITHISFDHDLGDDQFDNLRLKGFSKKKIRYLKQQCSSGYDCAKWMKEFYKKRETSLPIIFVHSMNPVGKENIIKLFNK